MGLHLENELARQIEYDHHRSHAQSIAAILVNCAPSREMYNYCIPHIIKENYENFLIHRCNYILRLQLYCVQVVKTTTIISNNPVLKIRQIIRYYVAKLYYAFPVFSQHIKYVCLLKSLLLCKRKPQFCPKY
jgi:hypothetical protein